MLENLDLAAYGPLATAALTLVVIALAEMGDKSQLVCMTLATRHRGWPVFTGALAAFALLNVLAVTVGALIAELLPPVLIAAIVALMFAGFGLHALVTREDNEGEHIQERAGRSIVLTTFLVIFIAEFGDKTQIAIAALSTTASPLPVWLGATIGLAFSAGLGIIAGRTVLQRVPVRLLKTLSGGLFLLLALVALAPLLAR